MTTRTKLRKWLDAPGWSDVVQFVLRDPGRNIWVCLLLAIYGGLLAWSIPRQSPTVDEPFHLAAGLRHWQDGLFDVDRGNPPLAGTIAALPLLISQPHTDWSRAPNSFDVGSDFTAVNGAASFWHINLGRWALIPVSLLGGLVCFLWASELFGFGGGMLSLGLWCFCPNLIAHGQVVTGDMAATVFGISSLYSFWKWYSRPSRSRAVIAGLLLGTAELSKYLWVLLYPVLPLLWGALLFFDRRSGVLRASMRSQLRDLALILTLGVLVTNAGYAFQGTLRPLEEYRIGRQLLSLFTPASQNPPDSVVTLAAPFGWLGRVPVPFPKDYMGGIEEIAEESERVPTTFLMGEFRRGGFWYFYPAALAVKLPFGTLMLLEMALGSFLFSRSGRAKLQAELPLVFLPLVLISFATWSGAPQKLRYILPVLPFLYILTGRLVLHFGRKERMLTAASILAIGASIVSSLSIYPHSLSYFNEFVGGPRRGYESLVESDIDWGQDVLFLKTWLDKNPTARPCHLACLCRFDPRIAGIEFTIPPKQPQPWNLPLQKPDEFGPAPGWFALSVNVTHGFPWVMPDGQDAWASVGPADYAYFRTIEPAARAGYSILIYHLTLEDANLLRSRLHLPALSENSSEQLP